MSAGWKAVGADNGGLVSVNAYYKDFVLLEQPSITEPKRTVKQIVDEAGLTVERFARFEVGQA